MESLTWNIFTFATKKRKKNSEAEEDPNTSNDVKSDTFSLVDIPSDILVRSIIPFIGEFQYLFVSLVNHAMRDAYGTAYPKKQTLYSTLTKDLTKISYEDSHRVVSLLVLYPMLAREGDLEMLKYLHALDAEVQATKNDDEAPDCFMQELLEEFAVRLPTVTCSAAAKAGQLHILKWCREHEFHWDSSTSSLAAKEGHLEILQFCHSNVCPWDKSTSEMAAEQGNLETLKWCYSRHCPFDHSAFTAAARNGHLGIVKWLVEKGIRRNGDACAAAAESEHYEVLNWLKAEKFPRDVRTYDALSKNGQLLLLESFYYGSLWYPPICYLAAEHGHLDIIEWYGRKFFSQERETCAIAARNGHLDIVEYCVDRGWHWDEANCAAAAEGGHLMILQYLRDVESYWDARTCAAAAGNGHLEVLQWCRANGCPWDASTCASAAKNGHLNVLKWCRQNKCKWNGETCAAAAENGHLDVLRWCRESGCPWDERTCMILATQMGHLDVLKWCHENGSPWYDCSNIAASYDRLDVLKWIHAHGSPCDEETYISAARFGNYKVQLWCYQRGCGGGPKVATVFRSMNRMRVKWEISVKRMQKREILACWTG
jgi:Ankyrin repeats (3 copies)